MEEDFDAAVEDGLRLSKRIYFGKDRAVAPPKPPLAMDRYAGHSYLPTSPMIYAVIGDPAIVDNPDMPSYQPHVHGRCDPPALIPLQLNRISLEVDCYMDTAFVTVSGSWRLHCVMGSRSCDCRIAVPMGEQGSILGVEAEVPGKSYCTQFFAMDVNEEKVANTENGAFLKPHIFTFTLPKIDGGTNISFKLRWSQKLMHLDGQFTLNVPFNFPDYVTPAGKKIPKHEKIELNVNSGPGTEIVFKTTSHPLKDQQVRQAGKLVFLYECDVLTWSCSDFSFTYTIPSSDAFGTVLLSPPSLLDVDDRKMFCCYLYPGNKQISPEKVFRREVVFIVDISGSMRGKVLEDTKNALFAALGKLGPQDSFNVIAFNTETYLFSSSLEPATGAAIGSATQWITLNFVAGGGTNILLPLSQAIEMFSESHKSIPIIFLVTDGAAEDERNICDVVKSQSANRKNASPRIYTLGIDRNFIMVSRVAVMARNKKKQGAQGPSSEDRLESVARPLPRPSPPTRPPNQAASKTGPSLTAAQKRKAIDSGPSSTAPPSKKMAGSSIPPSTVSKGKGKEVIDLEGRSKNVLLTIEFKGLELAGAPKDFLMSSDPYSDNIRKMF